MWAGMALKMAGRGAGALIALAVIALVVVSVIDANRYKGFIGLSVEGVSVASPPWGSRPQMVTLKSAEVRLALLPLLTGRVVVERLVLIEPDLLIETDHTGHGNWAFGAPAPARQPELPSKQPGAAAAEKVAPVFDLNEIRVERGRVTHRDGVAPSPRRWKRSSSAPCLEV